MAHVLHRDGEQTDFVCIRFDLGPTATPPTLALVRPFLGATALDVGGVFFWPLLTALTI
jgi:hypothetical protein